MTAPAARSLRLDDDARVGFFLGPLFLGRGFLRFFLDGLEIRLVLAGLRFLALHARQRIALEEQAHGAAENAAALVLVIADVIPAVVAEHAGRDGRAEQELDLVAAHA